MTRFFVIQNVIMYLQIVHLMQAINGRFLISFCCVTNWNLCGGSWIHCIWQEVGDQASHLKQIVTGYRLEIIVSKDVKIFTLVLFTLRELTRCTY